MVTEMTALAGTMGRHYALKEGLPAGKPPPLLLALLRGVHCDAADAGSSAPLGDERAGKGTTAHDCAAARPCPAAACPAAGVAEAIFESVLPRNAGDLLPQTPAGLLVSVADK